MPPFNDGRQFDTPGYDNRQPWGSGNFYQAPNDGYPKNNGYNRGYEGPRDGGYPPNQAYYQQYPQQQ